MRSPRLLALACALFAMSCSAISCSGGSSGSDGTTPQDDTGTTQDDTATDETSTGDDTGGTSGDTGTATDGSGTGDGGTDDGATTDAPTTGNHIKYVWLIVEENHNWSSIKGSSSAPYINSLLKEGAHAEKYNNPKGLHPSEPNYIWMEAGDNLGITDDSDPKTNSVATKEHLSTMLDAASISWKSWQEDMPDPTKCPLSTKGNYGAKHNPFVFFEDVTDNNDPASAHCIAHMAPTTKLESDLAAGTTPPRYNFITPNICNDMHGAALCLTNLIKRGDDWLKNLVPKIQATKEYKEAGAIFITWDEASSGDGPIGMIVLSPFAKVGFSDDTNTYTHSSLLRTVQTIFGVTPFLRDADKAKDLSNLFTAFP